MHPDAIDRVVRKYAGELGLNRGYSAHSMRATFITSAITPSAFLSGKLGDGLSGGGGSHERTCLFWTFPCYLGKYREFWSRGSRSAG
jgi:hypothetical protein